MPVVLASVLGAYVFSHLILKINFIILGMWIRTG